MLGVEEEQAGQRGGLTDEFQVRRSVYETQVVVGERCGCDELLGARRAAGHEGIANALRAEYVEGVPHPRLQDGTDILRPIEETRPWYGPIRARVHCVRWMSHWCSVWSSNDNFLVSKAARAVPDVAVRRMLRGGRLRSRI